MGKFWKHLWKHSAVYLSAWFRPEAELALPLFLDFKSECFCCGCIRRSQYLLGKKRDLRMCGVTKGFPQQMRPWGKFLCIRGILPRYSSLHTSPLGSVLSQLLDCKGKQRTSTQLLSEAQMKTPTVLECNLIPSKGKPGCMSAGVGHLSFWARVHLSLAWGSPSEQDWLAVTVRPPSQLWVS